MNHFIWLAAVALGEYFHQIPDPSCNRIKSLTFLIMDVKISHNTEITSFPWKYQSPWINSPLPSFVQRDDNLQLHHKSISSFWVCCKKIKSLAILISDVNISHHRGLTSFGQQEQLHASIALFIIPSPSNEMIICNYITNQSLHFA